MLSKQTQQTPQTNTTFQSQSTKEEPFIAYAYADYMLLVSVAKEIITKKVKFWRAFTLHISCGMLEYVLKKTHLA